MKRIAGMVLIDIGSILLWLGGKVYWAGKHMAKQARLDAEEPKP